LAPMRPPAVLCWIEPGEAPTVRFPINCAWLDSLCTQIPTAIDIPKIQAFRFVIPMLS